MHKGLILATNTTVGLLILKDLEEVSGEAEAVTDTIMIGTGITDGDLRIGTEGWITMIRDDPMIEDMIQIGAMIVPDIIANTTVVVTTVITTDTVTETVDDTDIQQQIMTE